MKPSKTGLGLLGLSVVLSLNARADTFAHLHSLMQELHGLEIDMPNANNLPGEAGLPCDKGDQPEAPHYSALNLEDFSMLESAILASHDRDGAWVNFVKNHFSGRGLHHPLLDLLKTMPPLLSKCTEAQKKAVDSIRKMGEEYTPNKELKAQSYYVRALLEDQKICKDKRNVKQLAADFKFSSELGFRHADVRLAAIGLNNKIYENSKRNPGVPAVYTRAQTLAGLHGAEHLETLIENAKHDHLAFQTLAAQVNSPGDLLLHGNFDRVIRAADSLISSDVIAGEKGAKIRKELQEKRRSLQVQKEAVEDSQSIEDTFFLGKNFANLKIRHTPNPVLDYYKFLEEIGKADSGKQEEMLAKYLAHLDQGRGGHGGLYSQDLLPLVNYIKGLTYQIGTFHRENSEQARKLYSAAIQGGVHLAHAKLAKIHRIRYENAKDPDPRDMDLSHAASAAAAASPGRKGRKDAISYYLGDLKDRAKQRKDALGVLEAQRKEDSINLSLGESVPKEVRQRSDFVFRSSFLEDALPNKYREAYDQQPLRDAKGHFNKESLVSRIDVLNKVLSKDPNNEVVKSARDALRRALYYSDLDRFEEVYDLYRKNHPHEDRETSMRTVVESLQDKSSEKADVSPKHFAVFEKFDPLHRRWGAGLGSKILEEWKAHGGNENLYSWADRNYTAGDQDFNEFSRGVHYLTPKERESLLVTRPKIGKRNIRIGGKPASDGIYIYVIDQFGNLYAQHSLADSGDQAVVSGQDKYFHHSSFLGGSKVISAGEIFVEKGKIVKINNNSGHYQPEHSALEKGAEVLRNTGLIDNKTQVENPFAQ